MIKEPLPVRWGACDLKATVGEAVIMAYKKITGEECNSVMEDCKASWHDEAHARAVKEADQAGLKGAEREAFIRENEELYYEMLEETGMGGLGL